ncbi:hypothetical protein QM012_009167 [Aureobasidium pullulans]|uniref:Uncharacterized protein n=1 Tax=Aureobasidium pullulans TaxID=5580 RepID=A0ABR0THK7_AURPU
MDNSWASFHEKVFDIQDAAQVLSLAASKGDFGDTVLKEDHPRTRPLVSSGASNESLRARTSILESSDFLQSMLRDPRDLLDHLMFQVQLLASLQWLVSLQVLACIPLEDPTTFEDVAELASVSKSQLTRTARITAMVGFLCESEPGCVVHSALSARFVLEPFSLDAVLFISDIASPISTQMTRATTTYGDTQKLDQTPFELVFHTTPNSIEHTKLRRQHAAFNRLNAYNYAADLSSMYDWHSLGMGTVVEICARSVDTVTALPRLSDKLAIIIQTNDVEMYDHMVLLSRQDCRAASTSIHTVALTGSVRRASSTTRVNIQYRSHGAPQTVHGAAVYLYYAPPPSATRQVDQVLAELEAELRSHYPVLRATPNVTLVIAMHLLPDPGVLSSHVEANLRTMDILLHQLANQRLLEERDILNLLGGIHDSSGRLVLAKKSVDRHRPVTVLEIKAEVFSLL